MYVCKLGCNGLLRSKQIQLHLAGMNSRCVTKCGETNKE